MCSHQTQSVTCQQIFIENTFFQSVLYSERRNPPALISFLSFRLFTQEASVVCFCVLLTGLKWAGLGWKEVMSCASDSQSLITVEGVVCLSFPQTVSAQSWWNRLGWRQKDVFFPHVVNLVKDIWCWRVNCRAFQTKLYIIKDTAFQPIRKSPHFIL